MSTPEEIIRLAAAGSPTFDDQPLSLILDPEDFEIIGKTAVQALEHNGFAIVNKAEVEQLIGQFATSYGSDDCEYAAMRWRRRLGLPAEVEE